MKVLSAPWRVNLIVRASISVTSPSSVRLLDSYLNPAGQRLCNSPQSPVAGGGDPHHHLIPRIHRSLGKRTWLALALPPAAAATTVTLVAPPTVTDHLCRRPSAHRRRSWVTRRAGGGNGIGEGLVRPLEGEPYSPGINLRDLTLIGETAGFVPEPGGQRLCNSPQSPVAGGGRSSPPPHPPHPPTLRKKTWLALAACCAATKLRPKTPINPTTAATIVIANPFLNKAIFSLFPLFPFASEAWRRVISASALPKQTDLFSCTVVLFVPRIRGIDRGL